MNKKNKKKGGKNKNDEIGGNKGKKNNIKERVFSSESSDSENQELNTNLSLFYFLLWLNLISKK